VADLITHACVAALFKAATGRRRVRTFIAGTLLPDLMARAPAMALSRVNRALPALPDELVYLFAPLHLPAGMLPAAFAISLLFPAGQRRETFGNLLGGMLLHLAVDLLQTHYTPGYRLLFPLSDAAFELGLIGSEDSVRAAPVLVLLVIVAWWPRRTPPAQSDVNA